MDGTLQYTRIKSNYRLWTERYNIQVLSLDTMDGTLQYTGIKSS